MNGLKSYSVEMQRYMCQISLNVILQRNPFKQIMNANMKSKTIVSEMSMRIEESNSHFRVFSFSRYHTHQGITHQNKSETQA